MIMSTNDELTIVTIKKQPRYTKINYREKLALCAQNLSNPRSLSSNIDDEEEFNNHILAIISLSYPLKGTEGRNQNDSILLHSSSTNDLSTSSIFEFLLTIFSMNNSIKTTNKSQAL